MPRTSYCVINEWKNTENSIPTPVIGEKVLESFGCENKEMFPASRDRYGSDVDIKANFDE